MKKNISTIGAFVFLLAIIMLPCATGAMLEEETVNTNEEYDVEPLCYGSIYGETYGLDGWMFYSLIGVHIEARIGNTVVGVGTSNIFAKYRIMPLPIGYTYTVTASCPGYDVCTTEITLTSDEPNVEVSLSLERNDEYDAQIEFLFVYNSQLLQSLANNE